MPAEDIHVVYRSDASGTTDNFQQYSRLPPAAPGPRAPAKHSTEAWEPRPKATRARRGRQEHRGRHQLQRMVVCHEAAPRCRRDQDWRAESSTSATTGSARPSRTSPSKARRNDLVLDLSKVYATTTPGVYPILLASYEIVCAKYPDAEAGKAVKAFMQSTVTDGQQGLTPLGYIPLPSDFQTGSPPPSTASAEPAPVSSTTCRSSSSRSRAMGWRR